MKCRICKSENVTDVFHLGEQYITSQFPKRIEDVPKTTVTLCMCHECSLVQLRETPDASKMYETCEYGYRSGINESMKKHLKEYNDEILTKVNLVDGDIIVDIGSNDSTMLQNYSHDYRRVGIDPTGNQFKEYYTNGVELIPTYFTRDAYTLGKKAKIVSSISMFYDLPDPVQFAKDIYDILEDDGIWTCEQSYLPTMLERNSIDTICHEHLEYYCIDQVRRIADEANFVITDVKFNDCNGGSFRVYFSKNKSLEKKDLPRDSVTLKDFDDFIKRVNTQVYRLKTFLEREKDNVYIYGASTKGNCLLQYADIGTELVKYAVERNEKKFGCVTSTGIEIISEETMRKNPPKYLLVLPWHFEKSIVEREHEFLKNGGQLIFPFPEFKIVSANPKMLITGSNGHISRYVKEEFFRDYSLYGLTKKDTDIENTIMSVKPDVIVHLAGISSLDDCLEDPVKTLEVNGIMTAKICDVLYRNNMKHTRLFNASSAEIFKGHVDYYVKDDDDSNMRSEHPYGIAKIMGQTIVNFYRDTYGLHFSNGILFTVESPHKSEKFLLKKVIKHDKKTPLKLGNLDSVRNIIHASDVAKAIRKIIEQPNGGNYNVCNTESITVREIVRKIFDGEIIETGDFPFTRIDGIPKKLLSIGWKPTFTIDQIIQESLSTIS